MKTVLKDQRGAALVLELLLVAAVVLVAGVAIVSRYDATSTTGPAPQANNTKKLSTAPTGSVDNAVDAITQEADGDSQAAAQEGAAIPQTDTSTGAAQNVETSYNANNF